MNGNKAETKENILEMVLRERKRLAEPGVVSIGLFGSFVRGDQNPESDIDLLVAFTPPHPFDNFMDLSFVLLGIAGDAINQYRKMD